ncbi:MAG: hypothetical protein U1F81_17415 [Verrucomicrobiaceae bacterium]
MRLIVVTLFLLLGASNPIWCAPPPKCDIVFSIPKNYSGVLLMVFNMPGGQIFGREFDIANSPARLPKTITVDFDSNGLGRIGGSTLPTVEGRMMVVERESNKEIPLIHRKEDLNMPLPAKAALSGHSIGYLLKGRKEFSIEPLLVGDPSTFPLINFDILKHHATQIAGMLTNHAGIPISSEQVYPSNDKK